MCIMATTQKIQSYIEQEAQANGITIPAGFSGFFPNFEITPTSAKMKGINLEIKGTATLSDNKLPFGLDSIGLSVFTSILPSFSATQDFVVTLIPDTSGKSANKIQLSFPIGEFDIPVPPLSKDQYPKVKPAAVVITMVEGDPWTASFSIAGMLTVNLFENHTISLHANASFTTNGDEITAAEIGLVDNLGQGVTLPQIFSDNIKLTEIGGCVGYDANPEGLLVGVTAGGTISNSSASLDIKQFTVVCDMEGDVPDPVYLGFDINGSVTLQEIMSLIVNNSMPLPALPSILQFVSPSFYYCTQLINLPNGNLVAEGVTASGLVSLAGMNTLYGSVRYEKDTSLKVYARSNGPIGIGRFVTLSGNGMMEIATSSVNNLSIPSTLKEAQANENALKASVVRKGGFSFTLDVNKNENPADQQFAINAKLKLLGMEAASVIGSLNNEKFSITATFAEIIKSFTASYGNNELAGTMTFENGGAMKINSTLNTSMYYGQFSPGKVLITLNFNITPSHFFVDITISIPGANILVASNVDFTTQTTVAEMLAEVTTQVEANADKIISQLTPTIWITCVQQDIIDKSQISAQFAMTVLSWLGLPQNGIGPYLSDLWNAIGFNASEVANAIKEVFPNSSIQDAMQMFTSMDAPKYLSPCLLYTSPSPRDDR